MIWGFAEMQRFAAHPATHFREADFCQFGMSWKNPTRFLCGNLCEDDRLGLARRCAGPRGFCSRTGARHCILEGPGPGGVPRTRTAQPYPPRLCKALSWALSNPARATFLPPSRPPDTPLSTNDERPDRGVEERFRSVASAIIADSADMVGSCSNMAASGTSTSKV